MSVGKWRASMTLSLVPDLQDVAILTRAVENVFRKLIKLLVGRISLVKLQEMIRVIFIQEAEELLRSQSPGKNVALTELALISGLDTRTLTKIRKSEPFRQPFHNTNSFLKEFMLSALILDVWVSKTPYFDPVKRAAKTLKISGKSNSFESLFNDTVKSRGVTMNSLLSRLEESGSIKVDKKKGVVSILQMSYLPATTNDQLEAIEIGFAAVGNLFNTIAYNLHALQTGEDRLFQRGVWTYRVPLIHQEQVRKGISKLLDKTDDKIRKFLKPFEESTLRPNQYTAGASLFYFEESCPTSFESSL
jgi:hypothetical protein